MPQEHYFQGIWEPQQWPRPKHDLIRISNNSWPSYIWYDIRCSSCNIAVRPFITRLTSSSSLSMPCRSSSSLATRNSATKVLDSMWVTTPGGGNVSLLSLGVLKPGCFKPGCLQFLRRCALLRSLAPFCPHLQICVYALLRSFACFCVRPRLERPRLGTADICLPKLGFCRLGAAWAKKKERNPSPQKRKRKEKGKRKITARKTKVP